jgi:hypothetical protein
LKNGGKGRKKGLALDNDDLSLRLFGQKRNSSVTVHPSPGESLFDGLLMEEILSTIPNSILDYFSSPWNVCPTQCIRNKSCAIHFLFLI